ncbi:MAG: hypothetical protein FJ125_03050 [Deltaproteobacteria bacterium]|nr:hypothetical protein [Deltaproteobacteria bacterium]
MLLALLALGLPRVWAQEARLPPPAPAAPEVPPAPAAGEHATSSPPPALSSPPLPAAQPQLLGTPAGSLAECNGRIIATIEVKTSGRPKERALLRQLSLGVGSPFSAEDWERDLQRMRNLGFFERIETIATLLPDGRLHLRLEVEANWSILPILGYQRSALNVLLLGLYDANLLGEVIELGGSYMMRDHYHLFRGWLTLPNVLAHGTQLELALVMSGSTLALYPSSPLQLRPGLAGHYPAAELPWLIPGGGYEILRRGFLADFGGFLLPDLMVSLRYLLLWETVNELTNLQQVVDRENRGLEPVGLERSLHGRSRLSLPALNVQLGRVDLIDNYLFRGHQLRTVLVPSTSLLGAEREFLWLYVTERSFVNLFGPLDLAAQIGYGYSSSSDPKDQLTLGGDNMDPFVSRQSAPGLLNIRGFRSSLLHGEHIAFANLEARATLTGGLSLGLLGRAALQLAAFVDVGRAWNGPLLPPWEGTGHTALSVGGGLLLTLRDFRFAYLHLYAAHALRPVPDDMFGIILTRPIF